MAWSNSKKQKPVNKTIKITLTETDSLPNLDPVVNEKILKTLAKEWEEKDRKYDEREKRNYNNWLAYRLITSYKDFMDSSSFYDFEKKSEEFSIIKKEALSKGLTNSNINVAIRYCRFQYYQKECNYKFKRADIKKLEQWKDLSVNDISIESLINKVYWDDMLLNYKGPSARVNRLKFLVENLEELKEKPYIRQSSVLLQKIQDLKTYYVTKLSNPPQISNHK